MNSERNTDDLQQELMATDNLSEFIGAHADELFESSTAEALQELYQKKKALYPGRKVSKAALARNAGINLGYLHQIFAGTKNPSRNCLVSLCFGMFATLEETQCLLKYGGFAPLYPRKKRDAIIIHGMIHGKTLHEVNEALYNEGEETLC